MNQVRATHNARAYIGLGSNLPFDGVGGPALLNRALAALAARGLAIQAVSRAWRSPPWPMGLDQPDYVNAAAIVEAGGRGPEELYDVLRAVEAAFGRQRRERWGPRTLDLDLLAMDGFSGGFGDIEAPHPRMHERGFVLAPLAEIAPDWRHPVLGAGPGELLAALGPQPGLQPLEALETPRGGA